MRAVILEKFGGAEAASVPVAVMTALCALRRARPEAGKSLLVAGSAGDVGSWAIGFAKAFGIAPIVTTAGSDASRGYVRDALGTGDAHPRPSRPQPR